LLWGRPLGLCHAVSLARRQKEKAPPKPVAAAPDKNGPETICDLGAGVPKRSELEPNHGVVAGGAADSGDCGWGGCVGRMAAHLRRSVFPATSLPSRLRTIDKGVTKGHAAESQTRSPAVSADICMIRVRNCDTPALLRRTPARDLRRELLQPKALEQLSSELSTTRFV
jgi:hypothetical protein